MSNVIDAQSLFGKPTFVQAPPDSLSRKFVEAGKLALGDRPKLARNLGKLAARIDAAFPLKAARLMFKEADRETQWPKRKRLMRLPDEPSTVATGKGDYEAFPGQYLALAHAAGRMIARSRGVGDPKHEVRESVRTLLIGTSFLPAYEPSGVGERSLVALLDELGSVISSRIGSETALTTLWSTLENSPMGLRDISSAEERADLDSSALGLASIYPESIQESGHGCCFDISLGEGASIEWAYPAVKVGTFVRDWRKRMFVLPPELAEAFDAPSVEDSSSLMNAWLSSCGWRNVEDDGLPDVEYDDNAEFGWKDIVLRSLYIAELRIAPDLDGRPRLQLEVRGLQDRGMHGIACLAYHPDYEIQQQLELSLVESHRHPGAHVYFGESRDDMLYSIELPDFFRPSISDDDCSRRVFGLIEAHPDFDIPFPNTIDLDEGHATGWVESAALTRFIFGGNASFYPAIEVPNGHAVPARSGSLAAAILLNMRYADEAQRLDRLLSSRAADLANSGLRYQEILLNDYRESLLPRLQP